MGHAFGNFHYKKVEMKKLFIISIFVGLGSCKSTLPIALNPDKSTYNSGTIGSVKATDNLPLSDSGIAHLKDTMAIKKDTSLHEFR